MNKEKIMSKSRKTSSVDHVFEEVLIYKHGKNNSHEKIIYVLLIKRKSVDFCRPLAMQVRIFKFPIFSSLSK